MHARQIKGYDIGRRLHIEQMGEGSSQWLVPSQSGRSPYTVDLEF